MKDLLHIAAPNHHVVLPSSCVGVHPTECFYLIEMKFPIKTLKQKSPTPV